MSDNHDRLAKLLSLAVHEFRTPMSVVAGYQRLLLRHFGDSLSDQQRKLIEESERSCGHLAALLSELSELAAFEGGQRLARQVPIALWPLVARVASEVHEGSDRGVTLCVRPSDPGVHVLGDPGPLAQAFSTLMVATLRERADPVSLVTALRLGDAPGGRMATVAIGEEPVVEQALDAPPDGSFDEYRGGLGFRLALAARIIAAHGGQVSSPVSARGRLVVVVSLPVVPDAESIG